MKKYTLRFLVVTLIGVLIYSCQNEDDFINHNQENKNKLTAINDIVLGNKLENPYSVTNMKKALVNLRKSSNNFNVDIEATHLYVKFIPKNEKELSILKRDSTLILYSYPLDYQIIEGSGYYRDPEVPEGQPTYQYCAVKVDKVLPEGVENEILEELFIPDENRDNADMSRKRQFSNQNINALVEESLRLTNNLKESKNNDTDRTENNTFAKKGSWRPAGIIKTWDDNIGKTSIRKQVFSHWEYYDCEEEDGPQRTIQQECRRAVYKYTYELVDGSYVGVQGVEVRARRWFTTYRGIADANGNYSCDGTFTRPANYSIDWERYHFALQDGWLNGATYNGPKITGDWNLNLKDDKQEYYATIFRAAHHYYYKDIRGLRRPPKNSFWRTQMKIRSYLQNVSEEGSLGSHTAGWRAFGFYSPIKIYTYQRPAIDTYATVIHELAHSSHWNMDRSDFRGSETKVKESWARGVQWELSRMVYPNYRGGATIKPNYTQVVMDMIDNDNRFGNTFQSGEAVSGYTIRQIENAINGQKSWVNWKSNIKNTYNNGTENNLDALFDYWN